MATPPRSNYRDAMLKTLDTDRTRSFQLDRDGWRFHVVFEDRGARLLVDFIGVEVRTLWDVTALYAHRPDTPDGSTVVEWPGGAGSLFCEDRDEDTAWNLIRELYRKVRDQGEPS